MRKCRYCKYVVTSDSKCVSCYNYSNFELKEISMKDDRDCKKCTYYLSDECISCTPEDSNFELKEKKMKVIIEVEESKQCPNHVQFKNYLIPRNDCEPVQEGWLTEEQFDKIYDLIHNCNSAQDCRNRSCHECDKDKAKERGWIKQSKTARQELLEKIEIHKAVAKNCCRNDLIYVYDEIKDLAIKALEAEKK